MSSEEALTDANEKKNDKHDDIVKSFSASFKVSDGMAQVRLRVSLTAS